MSAGGCEQRRDRMGIAFKEIAPAAGWGLTGREREGLRQRQREKSRTWAQTKAVGA